MTLVRRTVAALTGALLAGAGLAAVAVPARAADTVTGLDLTTFAQMAVDTAHQQVFIAGGPTSNTIEVRGFDGTLKGKVTGQTGASGVAVSPDGSAVYAALNGVDSVSRISTTTLTETARYGIGTGSCVSSVAFAGSRLFVGYGCSAAGAIAELDLGLTTPALKPAISTGWTNAPEIAGDATGSHLVAILPGISPSTYTSFDVAADPVTSVSPTGTGENCRDVAVEPTLGDALVACGFPYVHKAYKTTDMTLSHTYTTTFYPNAVAATDRGVAAGVDGSNSADIFVFGRHTDTPVRSIEVDPTGGSTWTLATRGLGWSSDSTKLFAVSTSFPFTGLRFHVYDHPLATASTLTLGGPATATRATAVALTGTLTGTPALPAGTPLTVSKTDLAGTHALAGVTTGVGGAFTVDDTPAVGGTNSYTVSYAGDADHQPASASTIVEVSRATPTLTLTSDKPTYEYKATATVTAHLGTTFNNRTVKIYATPYGASKVLIASGTVDASGNLTAKRVVTRRTTFSVTFPGDYRYAPRTVTRTVTVRAAVGETISGYYGTASNGDKLFRTTVDPLLTVKVSPNRAGQCIRFTAQRFSAGAWRSWASSACAVTLDPTSAAAASLTGSHPTGYRFRMRAEYLGDTVSAAKNGAWKYFRFG